MASALAEKIATKHNSPAGHNTDPSGLVKSYVDRLVALEEEKKATSEDIKEVKTEAKDKGLDPKALAVTAKRQMEDAEKRAKRLALEETIDQYSHALGLLD